MGQEQIPNRSGPLARPLLGLAHLSPLPAPSPQLTMLQLSQEAAAATEDSLAWLATSAVGVQVAVYQPGRRGTARVGVLTILPIEFRAARTALKAVHEIPGSGYYTPDPGSLDVVLKKGDRGNVAASEATRDLIEDFRPEVVLLVGIAGGLRGRDGIEPGDIVVPDYLHYADLRSLKRVGDNPRHVPHDPPTVSLHEECVFPASLDDSWLQSIGLELPAARVAPRVLIAPLVAGEKVYGDPTHPEQQRLFDESEFSDAVAVDMESVGVATAIHRARRSSLYNPRLLIVRGISDPVWSDREGTDAARREGEPDPNIIREQWRPFAAAAAAAFAASLVTRIINTVDERPFAAAAAAAFAAPAQVSAGGSAGERRHAQPPRPPLT